MQALVNYLLLFCVGSSSMLIAHTAAAQQNRNSHLEQKDAFQVGVIHIDKGITFPMPVYPAEVCNSISTAWSNYLVGKSDFKKAFPITNQNLGLSGSLLVKIDKLGRLSLDKPGKSSKVSLSLYHALYSSINKSKWKPCFQKRAGTSVPMATEAYLLCYMNASYNLRVKFVYNKYSYTFFTCGY